MQKSSFILYQFKKIMSDKLKSIISFSAIAVIVGILAFFVSYAYNVRVNRFNVYEEQLNLKYQGAKCSLVDEVQRYIDSVAPTSCLRAIVVVDNCIKYDIDVCFVLAQGQKESHFGTQGLARKTNSVWNVFAFDGQSLEQIHKKGKYDTPDDSVEPYMELLKK